MCQHDNVVRLHGYCVLSGSIYPGLVMDEYEMNLDRLVSGTDGRPKEEQGLQIVSIQY